MRSTVTVGGGRSPLALAEMMRLVSLLILTALSTGCAPYTNIHAPGATGRIMEATTGAPLKDARVTRPGMMSQRGDDVLLLPFTVVSDQRGFFDLPPAKQTLWVFMHRVNPYSIAGSFLVSADGYATNEFYGVATRRISWRAELGEILLQRE